MESRELMTVGMSRGVGGPFIPRIVTSSQLLEIRFGKVEQRDAEKNLVRGMLYSPSSVAVRHALAS